jgi:hypothetical protein
VWALAFMAVARLLNGKTCSNQNVQGHNPAAHDACFMRCFSTPGTATLGKVYPYSAYTPAAPFDCRIRLKSAYLAYLGADPFPRISWPNEVNLMRYVRRLLFPMTILIYHY